MPLTVTQEVYEIRSISPVHINPSILEGTQQYESILGPGQAITIVRYAPIFLVAPLLTGDPGIPSTLHCSPGVVDASPAAFRYYQWYIDAIPSINGAGIEFSTFLTDITMDAKTITCEVTATNTLGSASAVSNGILVGVIEPVLLGEYYDFAITGMGAQDQVSIMMDQIAVLTGMWVDDFLTCFQGDVFTVLGLGIEEHMMVNTNDIYCAEFFELLDNVFVSNSGAESGVTGWIVTQGTLRSVATTTPSGGGSYAFMGSSASNVNTTFYRDSSIDVSDRTAVDGGDTYLSLGFWACIAVSGQFGDEMSATVTYLDGGGSPLRTDDFFGLFEPNVKIISGNSNSWSRYQTPAERVPVGTRSIRTTFFIDGISRTGGSYCQLDLISLQLYQPI